MLGGCLEAKPASVPFVLSENRARRGSDLLINPEPEPSAELQGGGGLGVVEEVGGQQHLAEGGVGGELGDSAGGIGAGARVAPSIINKPSYQRRSENHSLTSSLSD